MSIKKFSNELYFVVAQDTKTDLGSMANVSCEIANVVLWLVTVGSISATSRYRINLYTNARKAFVTAQSQWRNYTDFAVSGLAMNYVRFDFDNQNLNKNLTYYIELEAENYIHDNDNYIGVQFDSPATINTPSNPATRGVKMSVLTYDV